MNDQPRTPEQQERERLAAYICELIRLADLSHYDQILVTNRLKKSSIETLREIAEATEFLAWMVKTDPERRARRQVLEARMEKVRQLGVPA
jgi:hypothetical protein